MSIQVENVTKHYGEVRALDNVSLRFEDNKIYGLLGRNGAGKSTLLNSITGRIFPTSGQILVDGAPIAGNDKALSSMYLMSEKNAYPDSMRVAEAFTWSKNFYPGFSQDYALAMAGRFGLKPKAKIKGLSTGYRSIFKLVIALSVNVPYVLLDEPVLGLDANHRELFYKMLLEKYAEKPFTAVISTHLIEEVANVIEDVIIIKEGKVLRNEPRETLLAGGYTITGPAAAVEEYIRGRDVLSVDALGGLRTAYLMGQPERGDLPAGLELAGMDLQKLFIQLTGM